MNSLDLFQLTQLAEASYANFTVPTEKQFAALQSRDFSNTQATSLLSQWSIASHQKNTDSGFSATLFRSKNPSTPDEYVLALRGTEQFVIDLREKKGTGYFMRRS